MIPLYIYAGKNSSGPLAPIQNSQSYDAKLMEVFEDGLIVYTPDFIVTQFNPAAEKIFKISHSDIVGRKIGPSDVQNPRLTRLVQTVFPVLRPL